MALGYRRVLLKLSGQALSGAQGFGLDAATLLAVAEEVKAVVMQGTELAIVVGGGNFWRGAPAAQLGMERVTADALGMLATVLNALALQDALRRAGVAAQTLSAVPLPTLADSYRADRAQQYLAQGQVVLCAGGTGNPLVTTDTAAALRAIELKAQAILMAKHEVDGVYEADPRQVSGARRFARLTYQEALQRGLQVMDHTALSLCQEYQVPIIVFNFQSPGGLLRVLAGEGIGTLVSAE